MQFLGDPFVVSGQEMQLEMAQPDIANAIVHRAGRALVIVDTGATAAFGQPLLDAARQLAPWSSVLLLTTHGHLDHVGNNDLLDEIAADAGIRDARHFVPAHDVRQLTDPGSYWKANLGRLAGVLPGFDDTDSIVAMVLGMFAPQRPAAARRCRARPRTAMIPRRSGPGSFRPDGGQRLMYGQIPALARTIGTLDALPASGL